MFAEDNCINLNDTLTNMNCFNLYDKLTNMNCNNLNDKLEYIKSPCNKLQNFMIDEPKINNDMRLFNNTNTPLVLNSDNGSGSSSNSMFSFFSIFNNLFSSNNSFKISEKNNEDSFYSVKGFPVYLLIFITIIVNIFIAIILTPVISVGIFIIIFLILIVAMLLLYMLTK
jgi:hypothetical protein